MIIQRFNTPGRGITSWVDYQNRLLDQLTPQGTAGTYVKTTRGFRILFHNRHQNEWHAEIEYRK